MTSGFLRACALFALLSPASLAPALAEDAAASQQPIEITAEGGIEWNRNARTYTASGAAQARRGDLSVEADTLIAHYRERATGGSEIYRLEAAGNVRLASQSAIITGDRAVYDVASHAMTVTGEALRLETATDVVTAQDRLEYSDLTRQASAHGGVVVVREDRRLDAEHVVATLAPGPAGQLVVSKVEAEGNVRIATPREFVRADRGSYDVDQQFAILMGAVKVTQDQNQLNGEYAEVDLRSGVSRLLGAPPGGVGGKVKGLVLPSALPEPGG